MITDAKGTEIHEGDLLLDPNGDVWRALPTDGTIAAQNAVSVVQYNKTRDPKRLYMRAYQVFVCPPVPLGYLEWRKPSDRPKRRRMWEELYAEHVSPAKRAELSARRARFDRILTERGMRK